MHLRGGEGEGDSAPAAGTPSEQGIGVPPHDNEPGDSVGDGLAPKAMHRAGGRGGDTDSPSAPSGRRAHARRPSLARRGASWVVVLAVAVGLAVLLRLFVFQSFYVPSSSMEPTLKPGDRMLVLKIFGTIHRGEIVVFRRPPGDHEDPQNEDLVKRVIGLPGQTIWSSGRTIYIDGKPIAQPWLVPGQAPGKAIPHLKIPPNDYFVMGDNRPVSYDSRYWTPHFVPRSNIIGQVIVVIWRNGHPYFKTF